jgi:serine/threonine protein kinase
VPAEWAKCILSVFDVGAKEDTPYVVSELLEGDTLRERLNSGALSVRKAVEYAVQLARGLAAAHEKSRMRALAPKFTRSHSLDQGSASRFRQRAARIRKGAAMAGSCIT